jgi:hypothetical protein
MCTPTPGNVTPAFRMTSRRFGRVTVALIGLAVLLAGCSATQRRPAAVKAAPRTVLGTAPAGRHGRARATAGQLASGKLLIFFKRVYGGDPTASQLTVDTNGMAAAVEVDGGIQGEHKQLFMMPSAQLDHLKRLITTTRLRTVGRLSVNYYTYWVTIGHRAWRLQQGQIPAAMRPLIDELDAITDARTVYT